MHNQNREEYKSRFTNPDVLSTMERKAKQWNVLSQELLARRNRICPPSSSSISDNNNNDNGRNNDDDNNNNDQEQKMESHTKLLELSSKLLSVNPDPAYLWNHRREMLLLLLLPNTNTTESSLLSSLWQNPDDFLKTELDLTAHCLKRNPKAYGAWHHRKWSLRQWLLLLDHSSKLQKQEDEQEEKEKMTPKKEIIDKVFQKELGLCAMFLELDERNFHCWNFRRFIVSCLANNTTTNTTSLVPDGSWGFVSNSLVSSKESSMVMGPQITTLDPSSSLSTNPSSSSSFSFQPITTPSSILNHDLLLAEWNYTQSAIERNFSNCSALHYRSKLLPLMAQLRSSENNNNNSVVLELALDELTLIRDAAFTEPDDQSIWWYHRFIVHWAQPSSLSLSSTDVESYRQQILEPEIESVRELNDVEGGQCKWAWLALYMLLELMLKYRDDNDDNGDDEVQNEMKQCLNEVSKLDPDRLGRYESMAKWK